ncbi:MAG TPA: glutamate formimidoyltransferase [Acidobacteriota bacterium]|nr:glutamate formimidoyltransferase [Acidobacteriota bacterium]
MPLIGCAPNVSEGRRQDVIQLISTEIASVRGVKLLDVSADAEINRSVFTFVGTQTPLRRAVYRLMRAAFENIDISIHKGKHPRIGIVDVIPFIPLRATTMERCIELSKTAGKDLAENFGVPVYLYEQSATAPGRVSINDIRSGEYEGFFEKIQRPEWQPDFGPARVHPTAGVVVVGARPPIITFNITLKHATVKIARQVIEKIRAVGARPRQVKAILLDKGRRNEMKIAVNLFDYKKTPMHVVLEAAEKAARRDGAQVVGVKLIGLITADALIKSLNHYMKVEEFDSAQVLEFHLPQRRKGAL